MAQQAQQARPQRSARTTRAWICDEVRELNEAIQIALEYFNIPQNANKLAARDLAKRARYWSVRWYRLRQSPAQIVNSNRAGRAVPFHPGKILQRTVTYTHDLERLYWDIWDLSQTPRMRVTRNIGGIDTQGQAAIDLGTPEEAAFDRNLRLCPRLTAAQTRQVIRSRSLLVLERKFARDNPTEHVSIVNIRDQLLERLPEFIIQLGHF